MFRTVVLAPDPEFGKAVERLALESGHLIVNKTVSIFPENSYDVGRVIANYDPEIVLVENAKVDPTLKVSEKLRIHAPGVAVLVLGGQTPASDTLTVTNTSSLQGAVTCGSSRLELPPARPAITWPR